MSSVFSTLSFLGNKLFEGFSTFCELLWEVVCKHPLETAIVASASWTIWALLFAPATLLFAIPALIALIITKMKAWDMVGKQTGKILFGGYGAGVCASAWVSIGLLTMIVLFGIQGTIKLLVTAGMIGLCILMIAVPVITWWKMKPLK